MSTLRFQSTDPQTDVLYHRLAGAELQPLWELEGLLTAEPTTRGIPYQWSGTELRELAQLAGALIAVDQGGDRRVLACVNPGLGGAPFAVSTLWAAVQYLNPHEVAPAHRHTPAALRFVVEGAGVWTAVDGDPLHMSAGDLILTPSWTFHEHHNPTDHPMLWLDVLDLPLVAALDAVFFQPGAQAPAAGASMARSTSESWYAAGPGLIPTDTSDTHRPPELPQQRSPLLAYRWADTNAALTRQLEGTGAQHARLRYSDPVRGGDVMPTMRCEIDRVLPGSVTQAARQTGGRVACVLNGSGHIDIGPTRFDLAVGDVFAIPSWTRWSITADRTVDIFSTSDAPVLVALGLYRSEFDSPLA